MQHIAEIKFFKSVPHKKQPVERITNIDAEVTERSVTIGNLIVPMANIQYIVFAEDSEKAQVGKKK